MVQWPKRKRLPAAKWNWHQRQNVVHSGPGLTGSWEALNVKKFLFGGMKHSKIGRGNGCITL